MNKNITITEERFNQLIEAEKQLAALIASGATNGWRFSDTLPSSVDGIMLPNLLLQDDSV